MAINEERLNEFMGNFVRDLGAVAHAATLVIGDQLGLYKALAGVADVGCGYHEPSIQRARAAAEAGVSDRVTFEVASAQDFPGKT